jgi:nucleotide-binding universal stress UspA family protein
MFNSVLLAVDLSAESTWIKSLPIAVSMAESNNAPLHVVTVMPDFGMSIVGTFFEAGFEDRALHDLGERLRAWVGENISSEIEVHPHILLGRVYEQILEAANSVSADVIVMASHRPELTDYLLGPNAARVVRHATQSVFVVRGT